MRILGRFTLLSLFAATGVALAVYVGTATGPSPARRAAGTPVGAPSLEEPSLEEPSLEESGEKPKGYDRGRRACEPKTESRVPRQVVDRAPPAEADAPSPDAAERADADSVDCPLVMPLAAALAEPYPARASQVRPDEPRLKPLGSFRFWKALASPLLNQVTPAPQPPRIDAPSPEADAGADTDGEPADSGPDLPTEFSPDLPADAPLARSKLGDAPDGAVLGEGDGQLSMQVPDNDIREVLDALSVQGDLNILATESVQGNVSASLSGVDVEGALDAILKATGYVAKRDGDFIYVGKPEDFEGLEKALDTIGTRVYRPNYVTAAELQALIQPLVSTGTGVVAVSSPAETGIGADGTNAGGDGFAGGDVVVVRDYQAVLAEVDQVVAEVDVRPMQVAIEAMILSVTLDDEDTFGASFEVLRDQDHIRLGWGANPIGSLSSLGFDNGGLEFGFLDSSLSVFFEALEKVGDTNVIATPRLMVLNKHRAEILIGEELGYVSTTMTETSTSQSVEFLEVGAQLRLRPFISRDGLIRMEVHPELSTGSVEVDQNFTLPNKETTQVTTNIMVRDGCTVLIGGLMREELEKTGEQVPFLGNLPILGAAFRHRKETMRRREILVLITPHIVYEPETCQEGAKRACEFHRRQDVYREKMSPLGKRHVARKYFRMAQNAWAAGDRQTALRFAELAVHFDPLNRAAIDLRSDVWLGRPAGDHTLNAPAAAVSPTAPLDGSVIDPWLLEQLQQEPIPRPEPVVPLHPLDPGQPGPQRDIERPRRFP